MSIVTNTICQKLESDFNQMNSQISKYRKAIRNSISSVKTVIQALTYSAVDAINNASDELNDNIDDYVPKFNSQDKIDEIQDIINSCTYLQTSNLDVLSILRLIDDSTRDTIDDLINSVISSLPEYDVAKLLNNIMKQYTQWDVADLIDKLFKVLDCIEAICGRDVSVDISEIEDLLADMYLLSTGEFDCTTLYSDLSLNVSEIYNISTCLTTYNNLMTKISTNISSGISFVKSLI